MNLRGLSFEAMPPLVVPYRFFITAPLSMIVIGILWLFATPEELATRWSPLMLATTHAITLGFMLMVMFGALFQVLPVVTAVAMPQAEKLSILVHIFLLIAVVCLVSGFFLGQNYLLATGALSVLLAFMLLLAGLMICFPQMRNTPTSWAIRLASLGLSVTVVLGIALIIGWLEPFWFLKFRLWTNTHLLWGIIGWALLLIMAVSFQIIPMFYVTPEYPKWISQFLPVTIVIQLLVFSITKVFYLTETHTVYLQIQLVLIAISALTYTSYTLYLISIRKRKAVDVTVWFWKIAMVSFIIALVLFVWIIFYQGQYLEQLELFLAAILLMGFIMALIIGMLLKIVPFLVWLNIQQKWIKHPSRKMPLSNMQQVIPINVAKRQYFLFIVTLPIVFIIFSGFNPVWLIKVAGLMFIITFGYLFFHLRKAKSLFDRLDTQLDSTKDMKKVE